MEPVWREIYEQRGAKRDVAGCKDLLLADRCITQDAIRKHTISRPTMRSAKFYKWVHQNILLTIRDLDFTSHDAICEVLQMLRVHQNILLTIRDLMSKWHTKFHLSAQGKPITSDIVNLKRGILQGDSLSPILFCITMLPLTVSLRQQDGYKAGPPNNRVNQITHALYMDDLKLYASSPKNLKTSIDTVVEYSNNIGMKLGLPKCAAVHITRGKPQEQVLEGIELIDGGILKHLSPDAHYKYLGLQETHTLDATLVKAQSKQKYINRLEKIWGSQLSAINKINATNILAMPLLIYTFGVVRWARAEKINATNILAMPLLIYTFGVVRWARAELSRLDEATRKIMAVVLLDVREKLMFVVEFSAPLDENLLKKEAEKKKNIQILWTR
ncbi:Reverse transcriptase (RNA-dependent DNA polymerase) [Popillia japonica]|uniref:Reverse transcriptase (RNA-dependent DNA polymerase) n=1 Tax=Popillia japonica TaxID=7064 RepID=A0AAW1MB38_POPJA